MAQANGQERVLSQRQLNRALLERQGLLGRWNISAEAAVERLVGMQAQAPFAPYYGLWTRLRNFQPDDLGQLLVERRVVRSTLQRGTIHLVTVRDGLMMWPVFQPLLERVLKNSAYAKGTVGVDHTALGAAARTLYAERPHTHKELGLRLAEHWPAHNPMDLAAVTHFLLPLVQVPPRAVWGQSGQATWTTTDTWLGQPLGTDAAPDELVLRYLAVYGPATTQDIQTWSGLTGLRAVIDRLRPQLRTFRNAAGKELFDVPNGPLPDPETPAPPRFLPDYENALISFADRTRIITKAHSSAIFTVNGQIRSSFTIDGFVAGTWKIERRRGSATLLLEPFDPLSKPDEIALCEERARLLTFAASDAATREIVMRDG